MRFGVILPIQSKDAGLDVLWEELREEVATAEEAGFDAVFMTEFHQARGGAFVSPLLLGAGLLQGTTRIRFGTAVLATPLHHPVRLAEDLLMLDHITRGRVVLGMGIAHQVPDFQAFGVPREDREAIFEEIVDVLELALAGEPYEYEGRFFQSTAHITPKPYSSPRPELWIGAHAPRGLERAGRRADRWIVDPQRDVHVAARLAEDYRASALAHGKEPRIALFREAWIGETREECERVWGPHALAVHRLYYNVGVYHERFEPWVARGARPGRLHARPARSRAVPLRLAGRGAGDGRGVEGDHRRGLPRAPVPPPRRPEPRGDARGAAPVRLRGDRAARRRGGVAVSRRYTGDWIVTSLLVDRAERFADEVAIAAEDGHATYAGLVERAARVGGLLTALGVQPGDRVATMVPSSLDYVAAWHGIVWAGAVDVPVNVEFRGGFLEHVLRDSGSTVLVLDARYLSRLHAIDLGDVRHLLVVGSVEGEPPVGVEVHAFADALAHDPRDRHPATETDPTYIMYTSGTTGPSKGAVHCNRSSIHYIMPFVEGLDLADDDVCYSMFPLFHQMGRSACTTSSLWVGNRVELRSGFSASGFWDDIRACGATWAGYFGAVVLFLWQQEPRPDDRDHGLRRAFGSSAAPELIVPWEERFGVTLFEVYGSTEIGLGSGLGTGPRKLGTMGLPCRHLEVQIVDERDEPVPAGVVGEALWRPKYPYAIFQGYWNRPEATLETFRNLWYHSGDAGYLDDEGYFVFKDRIKDSIRRRGENISSFEVEQAVREQPGVVEAAAYAVPGIVSTEEEVMVAVVPAPTARPIPRPSSARSARRCRATRCRGTCGSWTSSRRRRRSGSRSSGSARTASPRRGRPRGARHLPAARVTLGGRPTPLFHQTVV